MNKLKKISIALATAAIVAGGGLMLNHKQAKADVLKRVDGRDRYATAVGISKQLYPVTPTMKTDAVVLVSGETYADALAAAPLASAVSGPVLLTKKNKTPDVSVYEIKRLMPNPHYVKKTIYAIGGTAVINKGQLDWLISQGYSVVRLAGANRMETSVKVAEKADQVRGKKPDRAYIVNGYRFADGLAVGPLAAKEGRNILVTENGDLTQVVRDYVNKNINTLADVTIIGGTTVMPSSIDKLFRDNGFGVIRIAGSNRYDTAAQIASRIINIKQTTGDKIGLASGRSFPDGLAAGYMLASQNAPLLLAQEKDCAETQKFLSANNKIINGGWVFGGFKAVSQKEELDSEAIISDTKTCK